MKMLTIVPMIHISQEFGILTEGVRKAQIQKRGIRGANRFYKEIERYWQEVSRRIYVARFHAPDIANKLYIFVDGLPNADDMIVRKITADLIAQKIPVYLIIEELQKAGAKAYGTEDPQLLLQEHRIWTEAVKGIRPDPAMLQELLTRRDRAIAERIDEVLAGEESGLLFIGKAHDVEKELDKLSSKFRVVYL